MSTYAEGAVSNIRAGTVSFESGAGSDSMVADVSGLSIQSGEIFLIVAFGVDTTAGVASQPSGFSTLVSFAANTFKVFCKDSAGSESNVTVTFAGTTGVKAVYVIAASGTRSCTDVLNGTPATRSGAIEANLPYPAFDGTESGVAFLALGVKPNLQWTSVAPISTYTEMVDTTTALGSDLSVSAEYLLNAPDLSSGTKTVTGDLSAITRFTVLGIREAASVPSFSSGPTVSAQDDNDYTLSYTPSASATFYAVAYESTLSAPTCTQVKAGNNVNSSAAIASVNEAVTGADTTVLSISGTPRPKHNIASCLNNAGGDSSVVTLTNEALDAPAGYQFITLASIGAGSPCASFNTATNPDLAAGDILRAPTTTSPGSFALTIDTACQFSYPGDGSRQSALNILAYDNSVGAYHADDIDGWFNNQTPVPPEPDSIIYRWTSGQAITPIDLTHICPDAENDDITVTAVSGLAAGLSLSANTITGTPTTPGISTLTLRCTDITGASVDWQ